MSGFISVAGASSLALVTDAASYDREGIIVSIGRKVHVGKVAPIAMTTRGRNLVGQKHQRRLCEAADEYGVDFALEAFEDALPEMMSEPQHHGMDYMHWHILAFSETRGLIRFSAHNMPHGFGDGEEPGQLNEVSGTYGAGNKVDAAALTMAGLSAMRPGEDRADYMIREGASIMEAMRRKKSTPIMPGDVPGYVIGGHCDLTVVSEQGASIKTVRTWPDRIGSVIDPFMDVSSLNRQQRRAMEREARKHSVA